MTTSNRRSFLTSTAAGVAGAAAWGAVGSAHAAPKDRLRLGLIGCGGRGRGVAADFAKIDNVQITHVADPDLGRLNAAHKSLAGRPQGTTDFRRILDDKSVDGVVIATPDHWHTPAAILALEAGKHVYVEKPCSHNVREGRLLVDAARRHKRHVQHGTQSRSSNMIAAGIQMLRDGVIGDVLVAKAWNVQRRGAIGHAEPTDPPSGLNYDLWVGPAPMVPFRSNCHHYTWHWWFNFGTGDTGNDGVHEIDIARWGLGVKTHPTTISAVGGKYAYKDDQQFPDTQYVSFEYPGDGEAGSRRQLVFEMRLWSRYGLEGIDNGNAFYGTKGWMLLSKRGVLKVFDDRNRPVAIKPPEFRLPGHFQNFADAIRNGAELRAEIEVGHLSAALCHLANLSSRLGRSLQFDPRAERIVEDDEADSLLARKYREGHWAVPKGL